MVETEVLIIGQGLAGTCLSWWLHQAGISFNIIDSPDLNSASLRAAGLINPITGRRLVKTWMIEELLPFAENMYRQMGLLLGESLVRGVSLIDLFPSVQMLQAFTERYKEDPSYLLPGEDREKYAGSFRYELGWGAIQPCLLVYVEKLLHLWRQWLKQNGHLTESHFEINKLSLGANGFIYSDIHARHIVFCDGYVSARNPWFKNLPFAPNKGEGLLVEIKGLDGSLVYKKGMSLIPYRKNTFWLGSSYEWTFENDQPSENFLKNAANWLNNTLKLPFTILEHFAAIRPATLERRPFVGFHPQNPRIGILNGFGTKGCSLAPYFAKQIVDRIKGEGQIHPLADIGRFEKILTRQP
jgi:glycine/D-amino acid oxidase-like deaminating enzyme